MTVKQQQEDDGDADAENDDDLDMVAVMVLEIVAVLCADHGISLHLGPLSAGIRSCET